MAETIDVIMEGRDIGTNVFPNANVKIYLDATPEERARRRYLQNKENGIEMPYEEILESVKNAKIEGTVASPSSPSVILTALEVAIMTKTQNKIEIKPISAIGYL